MPWQPIATAPTDGTTIVVYAVLNGRRQVSLASYWPEVLYVDGVGVIAPGFTSTFAPQWWAPLPGPAVEPTRSSE